MTIKKEIEKLGLPHGSFMVVGSSVMAAYSLRQTRDIDMVVTEDVFAELDDGSWQHDSSMGITTLRKGLFDIGASWDGAKFEDVVGRAVVIDGIPYLSLADLRQWKLKIGRHKDIADVKLIDEYLRTNT